MTNLELHALLFHSSKMALSLAKIYVVDNMPNEFKYSVHLNISKDDINLKQFDIYPSDNGKVVELITANEVVNLLNRSGKVPVWIDISVEHTVKEFTIFRLLCAGRYSAEESDFYYSQGGTGPFGIKSPRFPIDYIEGVKFKLKSKSGKPFK
jgi:hypothetical protein